jgi:muramoyltetrapeptide carboxypeptidase
MQAPHYLKPGDVVGICAPARKISPAEIAPCISMLEGKGLRVKPAGNLFATHHQFAGTDEQRAQDLNALIHDKEVKAIVFARGGYGCLRIIQQVDWTALKKHPKWLVGFSDVTVLNAAAAKHGIQSLHAPLGICFGWADYAVNLEQTVATLMGTPTEIAYATTAADHVPGVGAGQLIGGNLSLLNNLMGTPYDYDYNGAILFIEELDEYLYHIDRMLQHLRLSGRLANLAGLIVGGFDQLKDNETPFGRTYREIVLDAVQAYHFPVAFDFPVGHGKQNLPLMVGRQAQLVVMPGSVRLAYKA